jgi:hypothetical protein
MPILRLIINATQTEDWRAHVSVWDKTGELVDEAATTLRFPVTAGDLEEIRWYLEEFLEDTSRPAYVRASQARRTLNDCGVDLFRAVFDGSADLDRVWSRVKLILHDTCIEIQTSDLIADAIPWEILQEPASQVRLALSAQSFVRRRPTNRHRGGAEPLILRSCRVLLVISRPDGPADVVYRSIASKVFQELHGKSTFTVTVLRPPSFSACARALREAKSTGEPFDIWPLLPALQAISIRADIFSSRMKEKHNRGSFQEGHSGP